MKLINPLLILRILSRILFIETMAYLLCLPVIFIYKESSLPFFFSASITLALSGIFYLASRNADSNKFSSRDGYLSVVLSWIVFSLMGNFAISPKRFYPIFHRCIF